MTGADERFLGTAIPEPAFPGDDGSADPVLVALLDGSDGGAASDERISAALVGARLLVPVVAVLDEAETGGDGLRRDKSSHMASVSLVTPAGHRAMLAFTGTESLHRWDPAARPVATAAPEAATAAVAERSGALLLDLGGEHPHAVAGPRLSALAARRAWVPPWRDPEVAAAVHGVLLADDRDEAFSTVTAVRLDQGEGTLNDGLTVLLELAERPDADLAALAVRVGAAVAALDIVSSRCTGGVAIGVTTG